MARSSCFWNRVCPFHRVSGGGNKFLGSLSLARLRFSSRGCLSATAQRQVGRFPLSKAIAVRVTRLDAKLTREGGDRRIRQPAEGGVVAQPACSSDVTSRVCFLADRRIPTRILGNRMCDAGLPSLGRLASHVSLLAGFGSEPG